MGLNKHDLAEVKKQAADNGYRPSSTDKDKWINGNGGSMKISETEKSVNINGGHYNSSSDTRKSSKW